MERSIWIFGVPDRTKDGFESPGDLKKYLLGGIFTEENGRFRHTQVRNPDVILLCRDSHLYGHLEVDEKVKPNSQDKNLYPKVRYVYPTHRSVLYDNPVPLSIVGSPRINRGA